MTSLVENDSAIPVSSNLATNETPAHRAKDQIDTPDGGIDLEGPITKDDQWSIINAYFDQNGVVNQ